MADKRLIEIKNQLKKARPKFVREEAHRRKRLSKSWRKPKGFHSKMRLRKAGKPKRVAIGYRAPKETRGLNKFDSYSIKVSNLMDLGKVKSTDFVLLDSKLGAKKKILIIKKAIELKLRIINLKDAAAYVKQI